MFPFKALPGWLIMRKRLCYVYTGHHWFCSQGSRQLLKKSVERRSLPRCLGCWMCDISSFCVVWCHTFRSSSDVCKQTWKDGVTFRRWCSGKRLSKPRIILSCDSLRPIRLWLLALISVLLLLYHQGVCYLQHFITNAKLPRRVYGTVVQLVHIVIGSGVRSNTFSSQC